MRKLLLATAAFAALSLSACSTIHKWTGDDDATPPPPGSAATATPAPAPATSAAEEKELSSVMGTSDNPTPPAVPVESVTSETTDGSGPSDTNTASTAAPAPPAEAPKECPQVEVLPDTKSITYFDDPEGKPSGALVARASLTDIKGGCDYSKDGVIVDIDMIMQGKITDKGRYQGRKDLEAFMTFPYFVAVMDPSGKMIDKKIMATAMRFKPQIDDLDHAEKITQTIPMTDIKQGPKYTITLGFQLNRAQLDYNRGGAKADAPAKADKSSSSKNAAPKKDDKDVSDKYSKGDLGIPDDAMPSVVDDAPAGQ